MEDQLSEIICENIKNNENRCVFYVSFLNLIRGDDHINLMSELLFYHYHKDLPESIFNISSDEYSDYDSSCYDSSDEDY